MSSNTEETDPGARAKFERAAKKADPFADRLLGKIQGSEFSAVIIAAIVIGLILFGAWAAW